MPAERGRGGDRHLNIANGMTALRIALAPFVIWAIVAGRHRLALILFFFAAITDVLDGALARRFHLESRVGAYLDPIADKLLMSGVFVAFAIARIVPLWFVALVLGRDLYILCAAAILMRTTNVRNFPPSIWGKASTFVQICTAVVWMARNMLGGSALDALAWGMLWPCGAITLWSGLHYTWRGMQLSRAH